MLAALIALAAWAQHGPPVVTEPTVQVRPRVQNGYTEGLSQGLLPGSAVFTRARVGLEMSRGTVSGRVVLQYVLDWEASADLEIPGDYTRTPPRLDLAEGWGRLEARVPGGVSLDLTFGRMLFTLHEGRLISANDWLVAAESIDGLHLDLRLGTFRLQVLNFRDFSDADALLDPGSTLVTIGSRRENPSKSHTFDLVVLAESVESEFRLTTGPYYTRQSGRFDLTLEGYVQLETVSTDDPLASTISPHGLVSARAGWTFGPERLLHTRVRYDVYSGPLDAAFEGRTGWATPLGDVYAFHGHMNLFQRPRDTAHRGLQDLSAQVTINPRPRLQFEADAHAFWTALDPVWLGVEADGTARVWFAPFASARIGYHRFFGGSGLRQITPILPPYGSGYFEAEIQF